ncbi:MAG: tRNA (cytidine(34)-2'-O)-methyltransferase [Cyanobacteriota bacterium]|nr:tRNA (cytidine(34)-2'-O)-methyltransferase [Cyanobacteriota bacterium]
MPRVVLFEPQIPPNTGNVARTCAATGLELHLIEPLGFSLSDRHLRRAGLDYWPLVRLQRHADVASFLAFRRAQGGRLLALSSQATHPYTACRFLPSDWLLFGRESDGLCPALLNAADDRLTIPMPCSRAAVPGGVRSLNLSVAVGVVVFEALRQQAEFE